MAEKLDVFFKRAEGKLGPLSAFKKAWLLTDWAKERYLYRVPVDEYFKYEFYNKNRKGRNSFVAGKRSSVFFNTCNDKEERRFLDDKSLFVQKYKEYTGRETLDMTDASFEEFAQFVQEKKDIFVKPKDGHFGLGVYVQDCGEGVDIKALYESLVTSPYMVEERIIQHPDMAAFNDTSVNTLRIITFVHPDGTASVMPGALIRIGRKGGIADNFHHGGIGAQIDEKTGIVVTCGLDQSGTRWVTHPDSGKRIVGFQVPQWEKLCNCVKKAALVCPKVRCVGWDVVLTADEKVVLIEGNGWPDPDLYQMSDGIGRWSLFREYLREVQAQ